MSSSDDFFSENIQVDLDDPGIWKANGESNDHIDEKDDMQSENTEESCMDGVLNRSIDELCQRWQV
eukprot:scaffold47921_cov55-Attheya_sp.AAC.1